MIRWLGAVMILCASSAVGIRMAGEVRKSLKLYQSLIAGLRQMESEIAYRSLPLGELLASQSEQFPPPLKEVFADASRRIGLSPGVPFGIHMRRAVQTVSDRLPSAMAEILCDLSDQMGREDPAAQTAALEAAADRANRELEEIRRGKKERCRNYETIGVCAGLALAVILI